MLHSSFDEDTYRKRLNESTQGNLIRLVLCFRRPCDDTAVENQKSKIEILIDFFESTTKQTPLLPIDLEIEKLNDPRLEESTKKLIVVLSQLPNLKILRIRECFQMSGFEAFVEHFQDSQILENLDVRIRQGLERQTGLSLQKLLQGKICLDHLSLSSSGSISIDPDTLRVACSKQNLQVLRLDGARLKDDSMPHIISSVSSNPSLKHLSLRWNEFDASIFDLATMLETNTTLRSLVCGINPNKSTKALAFALQKNTTLRHLILCPNESYWRPSEEPFLESMKENYTLESIFVSDFISWELCREYTSRNKNNRKQKEKTLLQMLLPLLYHRDSKESPKKRLL